MVRDSQTTAASLQRHAKMSLHVGPLSPRPVSPPWWKKNARISHGNALARKLLPLTGPDHMLYVFKPAALHLVFGDLGSASQEDLVRTDGRHQTPGNLLRGRNSPAGPAVRADGKGKLKTF